MSLIAALVAEEVMSLIAAPFSEEVMSLIDVWLVRR